MLIKTAVDELHDLYNKLNEELFGGDLPEVALTIQSKGKRNSMGWFTVGKVWNDKSGEVQLHEINISAEYLNVSVWETVDTLMHEMVHLWNHVRGIQDTSRGGTYHNTKFRDASIMVGFEYKNDKPDKRYGWSFSSLAPQTIDFIKSIGINENAFAIGRKDFEAQQRTTINEETGEVEEGEAEPGEKKQTSWRLTCPKCNLKLRASKAGVRVKCIECDEEMTEG